MVDVELITKGDLQQFGKTDPFYRLQRASLNETGTHRFDRDLSQMHWGIGQL
jgi:hypothetical protein